MTKRQGILAAISAIIGIMSGKAKIASAQSGATKPAGSIPMTTLTMPPQTITFSFDAYEAFVFQYKGQEVRLTNKEIFDALSRPTPE